ncbi:MAG: AAA family ATPase [bacterium]
MTTVTQQLEKVQAVVDPQQEKTFVKMLVYGSAGSGKSIFASTFPKCLIFDTDRSHGLYKKFFPNNKYIEKNFFNVLQQSIKKIEDGSFPFETIVIDSVTALENEAIALAKGLDPAHWSDALYTSKGKKLGYDEWGNISSSTIALFTYLKKLPINLVIITQIEDVHDSGAIIAKPNLIGKGANESLHFAEHVGFMEAKTGRTGKIERLLHLSSTVGDKFKAKARLMQGNVEPIKNPHYDKVLKLLQEDTNHLFFGE